MPVPFIVGAAARAIGGKLLKTQGRKVLKSRVSPAARKRARQLESIWNERGYTTKGAGKGRIKKLKK